jgi:hypothetical protein
LPTHVGDRRAAFGLVQRVGDLLVSESLALHGPHSRFRRTSEAI